MIGCGLALNDTGFIPVQATCPTSSSSQSETLFLSPGAWSLLWGYKQIEIRRGVLNVWLDSEPKGQEWRELLRALSIRTYALCSFRMSKASREWVGMIRVLSVVRWIGPLFRRGCIFYRWRGRPYKWERECVLPSLIAHAIGCETVCRCLQYCRRPDACGWFYRVLLVWQMLTPTIL